MKLLIAEDDTGSRLVLAATLRKLGHDVTAVANGLQAWEAWQKDDYPLLISDWMMPELDGQALFRKIRAEHRARYTYLILLTSLGGKGSYLDGMDAGADDFITKPFDEELLAARLHVAERILALHEVLRVQATHDRLTGLLNRGATLDFLQQELERSSREGSCVGVIMVDLDHFKQVNDIHGHLIGDAVLQEAARRMQAVMRSYDRIGRYGGEEFLILSPGCNADHARTVAERIRGCMTATPIQTSAGELIVTASLGVAISRKGAMHDADTLIASADAALYRAKHAGRNRVEMADPEAPVQGHKAGSS
ncbi:MAG: diguanylate cyclase [Lysobacteraceae bacterium]